MEALQVVWKRLTAPRAADPDEARREYLDAGFSDCLFKPFTAEQLAELIARHTG